ADPAAVPPVPRGERGGSIWLDPSGAAGGRGRPGPDAGGAVLSRAAVWGASPPVRHPRGCGGQRGRLLPPSSPTAPGVPVDLRARRGLRGPLRVAPIPGARHGDARDQ